MAAYHSTENNLKCEIFFKTLKPFPATSCYSINVFLPLYLGCAQVKWSHICSREVNLFTFLGPFSFCDLSERCTLERKIII